MIKQLQTCISVLLILNICLYAMEPHDDIQTNQKQFLKYPEEYANFRLTRPYGKLSISGYILQDVFNSFIEPHVRALASIEYKHYLLERKKINKEMESIKERNYWDDLPSEDIQKTTFFEYYDGRCDEVPKMKDKYHCWDGGGDNSLFRITIDDGHDTRVKLLLMNSHSALKSILCCPAEEYENQEHHLFFIKKQNDERWTKRLFHDEITSYIFSYDGGLILFGADNNVKIFDVSTMNYQEISNFNGDVKITCAANKNPFFAVWAKKEVRLINATSMCLGIKNLKIRDQEPKFIEFSPTDKYIYIATDHHICLIRVGDFKLVKTLKSKHAIIKIFFVSDDTMIIAFANGKLVFWSNFSKNPKANKQKACWRKMAIPGKTEAPLVLWNRNSNLLFTVDYYSYYPLSDNFMIRALDTGLLLFSLNIFLYFPYGMGLLKDERTVVFYHSNDKVAQLQLYDDKDNADIDFVEREAHWYQLCFLSHICKNRKQDESQDFKNSSSIVSDVQSIIESYRKKQ